MDEQQHYLRVLDTHIRRTLASVEDPQAREQLLARLEKHTHAQIGLDDAVAMLLRALWKTTEDEFFGLSPEKMPRGTWALACDYMLDGGTLQELLQRGQRIFSFLPPASKHIRLGRQGNIASVTVSCYTGEGDPEHFLIEFYTMLWHRFLCWAVDEAIPLSGVYFAHPRPAHHAVCQRLFDCPIEYDRGASSFAFSAGLLQSAVRRSKPELASWLKESPVDIVSVYDEQGSMKARLRGEILRYLKSEGSIPAYDDICRSLGLGPQTLRRQLKLEGTSYQGLKDELLRNLVTELLNEPGHSLEDVVQLSGYCDSASLTRACKRWFGMTPGQYRLIAETQTI
ncbi:AraC family transcriptional regulator ligand-binding domain-containing protein [Parahaliea mediterranea]|uniref:AraC family transcriptional regulator ligand-binding domain-containing protein n=1 Tax=Parahaliea mediterranea TaxID=651086 RepID=A0A939DEY6_9GAMM|nr:AraC family transcriptional regulator ligand-binding domain-containing protein [Parahaliea mediterranea]